MLLLHSGRCSRRILPCLAALQMPRARGAAAAGRARARALQWRPRTARCRCSRRTRTRRGCTAARAGCRWTRAATRWAWATAAAGRACGRWRCRRPRTRCCSRSPAASCSASTWARPSWPRRARPGSGARASLAVCRWQGSGSGTMGMPRVQPAAAPLHCPALARGQDMAYRAPERLRIGLGPGAERARRAAAGGRVRVRGCAACLPRGRGDRRGHLHAQAAGGHLLAGPHAAPVELPGLVRAHARSAGLARRPSRAATCLTQDAQQACRSQTVARCSSAAWEADRLDHWRGRPGRRWMRPS